MNSDISSFEDPCKFVCEYNKQIVEKVDSEKALNKLICVFIKGYRKIRR